MDKEFLTINEVSEYLKIKPSTLYSWVKAGEIPHYHLHKMVRFKKEDIDVWMESHRSQNINTGKRAREILKAINRPGMDIGDLAKKYIAEVKGNRYTPHCGRSDRIKDLREEG